MNIFEILDYLNLERGSENFYFMPNGLVFNIRQRYVWNIDKNCYEYISLKNEGEEVEAFSTCLNMFQAFFNKRKEIKFIDY